MPAQRSGYIALLSVLIVSAIASATIAILFLTSLNSTLNSGNVVEGKYARSYADACAELALQRLSDNWSTPCTKPTNLCAAQGVKVAFSKGMCKVEEITDVSGGTDWRIRTTGSGLTNTIKKYIEIDAYRNDTGNPATGSAVTVFSWKECVDFSSGPPCTSL